MIVQLYIKVLSSSPFYPVEHKMSCQNESQQLFAFIVRKTDAIDGVMMVVSHNISFCVIQVWNDIKANKY